MFIYPDNLKAKATLWLWELRDVAIIGIGFLFSVLAIAQTGILLPLVATVIYAFLSIRLEGSSILDFLRYAVCLSLIHISCQDLSVAGARAGLAGARSGLFMEQIRIIKEMRIAEQERGRTGEHIRPRFMVWENVPGAFSSGTPKGEDFRICLLYTSPKKAIGR